MVKTNAYALDRRTTTRNQFNKYGLVVIPGGIATLEVTVIDINAHGAKLSVFAEDVLPTRFNLLLLSENRILPSIVIWRVENRVGIRFT